MDQEIERMFDSLTVEQLERAWCEPTIPALSAADKEKILSTVLSKVGVNYSDKQMLGQYKQL